MRVFVTGGAGFIGLAVVRRLVRARRSRSSRSSATPSARPRLWRDSASSSCRATCPGRRPSSDAMRGTDAAIHLAGIVPRRHPGERAPRDARRQRRRDAPRPRRARSPPARPAGRRSRRSTSSATRTAGSSTRRYRRDLAEGFLSYYDETKYLAHARSEERIDGGAPDRHRHARRHVRPERPLGDRRSSSRPPTTARCAYVALGDLGHLARLRRRRRGRHRRGARPRPDRRVVLPGRREHAAARRDARRGAHGWAARPAAPRDPDARSCASARTAPRRPGARCGPARRPRRGRPRRARRDVLGSSAPRPRPSSGTAARSGERPARRVRRRLTAPTGPSRDRTLRPWPASSRCSSRAGRARPARTARSCRSIAIGGGLAGPAGGRRLDRPAPPPRLDPRPDAVGRQLPRPEGPAPRPRRSTRSARRPTARTSGSAGTSAPPRS